MTTAATFTRIVSMVADLTRRERAGEDSPTIESLAAQYGTTTATIAEDIRTLTILGDHASSDWLLSLRVLHQGDQVSITSDGPFRRPVRFSPEEQMALQLALAFEPGGEALAARLAKTWSGTAAATRRPAGPATAESTLDCIRRAIAEHTVLELTYAGEADRETRERVAYPHQVAALGVSTYVVAWVVDVGAWRHFRLDRIVQARETGESFDPRDDFRAVTEPADLFRPAHPVETATVRFDASAAPWVRETYPDHVLLDDGRVDVRLPVSSTEWLTRQVLKFGAEAEVVEPAHFREAVRRAIA